MDEIFCIQLILQLINSIPQCKKTLILVFLQIQFLSKTYFISSTIPFQQPFLNFILGYIIIYQMAFQYIEIKLNRQRIQDSLKRKLKNMPIKLYSQTQLLTQTVQDQHIQNHQLIVDFLKVFQHDINHSQKTKLAKQKDFYQDYMILKKIGEGAHGIVKKCIKIQSQQIYAVKVFRSGDSEILANLKKSFYATKTLRHKNLRQTYQLFINQIREQINLVMEFINYPSLKHFIRIGYTFSEAKLKKLTKYIISGLKYLHKKGITHRDIKPQNILYHQSTEQVKIIDFQICKLNKNKNMWSTTGSLCYKAPQMFNGSGYNELVDMWALGVTLYQLVTHKLPFDYQYQSDTIQGILEKQPNYSQPQFKKFSPHFIQFLKRLLLKNPQKRLKSSNCLKSAWMLEMNNDYHENHFQNGPKNIRKYTDNVDFSQGKSIQKFKSPHLLIQPIERKDLRRNLAFDIYEVPKMEHTRYNHEDN